jgi:hypothetical protein
MGIWRQKQEESKSIWFRVPASLKKEFEELRQQAEAEGMDASATFTAALWRLAKQLREELPRTSEHRNEAAKQGNVINGHDNGDASRPGRATAAA